MVPVALLMDLGYKSIIYTAVNTTPRLLSLCLWRRCFEPLKETMSCWIFFFFLSLLLFDILSVVFMVVI